MAIYGITWLYMVIHDNTSLFLVAFTGKVCDSHLEITLLIHIMCGMNFKSVRVGSYIDFFYFDQNVRPKCKQTSGHITTEYVVAFVPKSWEKERGRQNAKCLQNGIFVL